MGQKTKKQLLEERALKLQRRSEIKDAAGAEKRNLTAEEVTELEEIRSAVALINAELDELEEQRAKDEAEARAKEVNVKVGEDRGEQLRMTRLLRGIANNNIDDSAKAIFTRGAEELRAAGVTDAVGYAIPTESRANLTTVDGAKVIQTEKKGIIEPLMQELIFAKLGANVSTGLRGNIEFVKGTAVQANWKGENVKAGESKPSFSAIEFKPKRLAIKVPVSLQLLMQDSLGVEAYLLNQINLAIQTKLESTAFGAGAASDGIPAGLFTGTIDKKGVMSYDRAIDLINTLDNANALKGNLSFVTSPAGFAIIAKTPFSADKAMGYLADYRDKNLIGYNVHTTSAVPNNLNTSESGIIFANWADFFVGQWGALVFTADNVTQADQGIVNFVVNTWWDFGWLRDESKVVASIKTK